MPRVRGDEPLYLTACGAFNAGDALNVKLHNLDGEPWTAERSKPDLKEGRKVPLPD